MSKQTIVIFEGIDKSGKSTLLKKFNELTNYKYWVLDRGFVSSLVYNELFNRENKEEYLKLAKKMCKEFDIHIVYCYASYFDIQERLKNANETLPPELEDILDVSYTFEYYLRQLPCNKLYLNTSTESIDECVKSIYQFVEGLS